VTLPANITTILKAETGATAEETPEQIELSYVTGNFLIAPDKGLPVTLTIDLK
jgi:hypothetical protein